MVIAMRAHSAGGSVRTATVAISSMREVNEARPRHQGEGFEIVVPEARRPAEAVQLDHRQGEVEAVLLRRSTTSLLSSKLGVYCGDVVEISQPLFPMGMKTPISIMHLNVTVQRCSAATPMVPHADVIRSSVEPTPSSTWVTASGAAPRTAEEACLLRPKSADCAAADSGAARISQFARIGMAGRAKTSLGKSGLDDAAEHA
jgi:hypothetical protein